MNPDELWNEAIREHNTGDFHEAHELFEDLWLETIIVSFLGKMASPKEITKV